MTTSRLEDQLLRVSRAVEWGFAQARLRWRWLSAGLLLLWLVGNFTCGRASSVGAGRGNGPSGTRLMAHTVEPLDLRLTALESGTLESASSSPVHSEVHGQVAIIKLVAEGTRVEKGDVVVELDSSNLIRQLNDQRIAVENANNAHSKAVQANVAASSKAQSDVATAELALEFAKLDLEKYQNGEYPLLLRTQQTDIALAEETLERTRVQFQFSEDLAKDGYLHEGELAADRFRMTQAEFKVENAKESLRVLQEYTYPRTKRDLESKALEAERALTRVKSLAQVDAQQAQTSLRAQERTLALEQQKLADLESQIESCTMRAPQAGVVVYPVPQDDDLVELFIKQGTMIRERQHVFSIPDTDVLQVSTSLHEAIVNQIRPGLLARIKIDVLPDLELAGEVLHVSPLPEPGDWRRTTVKFYETKVKLREQAEGLRPGMSAKVEILIDQQLGVLAVPVQSVLQKGEAGLCYMFGRNPELRRLRLGKSNSQYVAVLEGLKKGDRIVLSPDILGFPAGELEEATEFAWSPDVVAKADIAAQPIAAAPEAAVQETEYEAELSGPENLSGEAQYEVKVSSEATKYEFEVKIKGGMPQATWDVAVDGIVVGSVTLDAAGACDVEWSTKKGTFPANFPKESSVGTPVTIGELQGALSLK